MLLFVAVVVVVIVETGRASIGSLGWLKTTGEGGGALSYLSSSSQISVVPYKVCHCLPDLILSGLLTLCLGKEEEEGEEVEEGKEKE